MSDFAESSLLLIYAIGVIAFLLMSFTKWPNWHDGNFMALISWVWPLFVALVVVTVIVNRLRRGHTTRENGES